MAQDLATNITRQFQVPLMDQFKPFVAAIDELLPKPTTVFDAAILPAINLPTFTLPQIDLSPFNSIFADITRLLPAFEEPHELLNRTLLQAGPPIGMTLTTR